VRQNDICGKKNDCGNSLSFVLFVSEEGNLTIDNRKEKTTIWTFGGLGMLIGSGVVGTIVF